MTDPGLDECHYLDIGQPSCRGVPQAVYNNVASLALEVEFFVAKMGNDRCVKNIVTNTYWYGN
jgi:hypothetical protein